MTVDELRSLLDYDTETGVFRWRIAASTRRPVGSIAGTPDRDGYVVIRIKGRGYKAHRLAWLYVTGRWPAPGPIDHKNEIKTDNRFDNLREATPSMNALNITHPNSNTKSGFRGVSWFAQYRKWKATFQLKGRKFFVGHYDCPQVAHAARCLALEDAMRGGL